LSSIALLFAIISHNPPPFSILDEVEAALDEANSKRFGRILSELSKNSQFVIITHNRETMRQASLLYGITMGEDGISKLLSVRLDQIGQGGQIKA
jgi:chromosome segregation protein